MRILIVFLLSISVQLCAQSISREVISSGGKENNAGAFTVYSTIGELSVQTYTNPSLILTQGFEQPENILITGVPSNSITSDYLISIFPNPAIDKVTIVNMNGKTFHIEVLDINGQLIKQNLFGTVSLNRYDVDLSDLGSGIYFISISNSETKQNMANYKLVKL